MCKPIEVCSRGAVFSVEGEAAPLGGGIDSDREKRDGCGLCAAAVERR